MNKEFIFNFDKELTDYISKEICKYINEFNTRKVLYNYNRMTIDELTQETVVKVLRSIKPGATVNKAFVRRASRFVCIDEYRKKSEVDISFILNTTANTMSIDDMVEMSVEADEVFGEVERQSVLKHYEGRDREVIIKLMEGYKNGETLESLGIPRMTYYTLLKRLRLNILHTEVQT